MTIDEAIAQAREKAEEIRENLINGNNLEPYESYCNAMNERRVKKHEQIAEWLELLKWYEHGMEDIPSESGVLTKDVYHAGYNKAIDDLLGGMNQITYNCQDADELFEKICDLAEQLKVGGENE